jgi:acetylornithine/succinyldiaminopimelate/putrescine aminotransferase
MGAEHGGGAYEIITMDHGFHGRTLAMMSASGKLQWERLYEPKVSGFVKVKLNDLAAVEAAMTQRTVAVMLEPIQGEAGVFEATEPFLRDLRALTRDKGVLLILDEIQTGIGRTGRVFGYEHAGITPDIMTLAKGLGGGVPLAALVAHRATSDASSMATRVGRFAAIRSWRRLAARCWKKFPGPGSWRGSPKPGTIWRTPCTRFAAGTGVGRCAERACCLRST